MRTLMITRGLPGSGKSSWAKEQLRKEPKRWKRVNNDDLRNMIDNGVWSEMNEKFVRATSESLVRSALQDGWDVIVDNTHLHEKSMKRLHRIAESVGDVLVVEKPFNVPLAECLKRNAKRTGSARVPDHVIQDMAERAHLTKASDLLVGKETYYAPVGGCSGGYEPDPNLPWCIICDLDGTLALLNGRDPYDASTCDRDEVNLPVKTILDAFKIVSREDDTWENTFPRTMPAHEIIFMSGRKEQYREPTLKFLKKIGYDDCKLFMRADGDERKDAIIKEELYEANIKGKYNVRFVLDDRDQVVKLWREDLGLTCLQVNYGAF